jgi:hypothetical protein
MLQRIEVGYQVFVTGKTDGFGAVRGVSSTGLVIYIENAGDFTVPFQAVEAVHSQKVIFERTKLHRRIREAIRHAHDAEDPSI